MTSPGTILRSLLRFAGISFVALTIFAAPARAATCTWSNAAGGAWLTATNWNGGVAPTQNDIAKFDTAPSVGLTFNNTVAVGAIWVTSGAGNIAAANDNAARNFNIYGGQTINGVPNVGIWIDDNLNRSLTIGQAATYNTVYTLGADQTWYVGAGNTLTLNTGTSTATITLNGKTLTIDGAGTTYLTRLNTTAGNTGSIIKKGTGSAAATGGFNGGIANLTMNGGTFNISQNWTLAKVTGTIDFTGNATLGFNGGVGTYADFSGKIKIEDGVTATIDTGSGNTIPAYASPFQLGTSGTGGLTKTGSSTLTISANNTYTGDTVVAAGTLRLSAGANTPSGLKIMPLGDSITYGSGGTKSGYRGYLYSLLATVAGGFQFVGSSALNPTTLPTSPTDQTHHDGHPSATIQYISNNLDGFDDSNLFHGAAWSNTGGYWFTGNNGAVRAPIYPDIITLMIGTNDIGSVTTATRDRLDSLIAKITTMRPDAKVIVADITPRTDSSNAWAGQVATYNGYVDAVVAKYAALGKHVTGVDLNTGFPANGLSSDGVHPNDTGYSFMATQWSAAISALYPGASGGVPSLSATTVAAGATLDVNSTHATIGPLSGTGNVTLGAGGILTVGVPAGSGTSFSGTITGTGSLNKAGGGTLTISGASTYTGPTLVDAGILIVNGSIAAGGPATIAAGATLSGNGTIAAATTVNGTHAPGAGIGTQTFTGTLAYGATGHLKWEPAGNTASGAGTNFDRVAAGSVTVTSGASLDVALNGATSTVNFTNPFWLANQTWTVLAGTDVAGAFALGPASNDAFGNSAANYGTFALQQTPTAVALTWTPFAPIEVWRNLNFGADAGNAAISGDLVDTDHDGLPNLLEYALGLDPHHPDPMPQAAVEGDFLTMTYFRSKAATDVTLRAVWSTDLSSWSNTGITVETLADSPTMQQLKAKVPVAPDTKKFLRIEVTRP